jgi:hypothetical protein
MSWTASDTDMSGATALTSETMSSATCMASSLDPKVSLDGIPGALADTIGRHVKVA